MSYIPSLENFLTYDAAFRKRVSEITTLFDGKILNEENLLLWDVKGTGTNSYSGNCVNLAVTSGQYLVRQSRIRIPYFSGKSQLIEATFDSFAYETNVVKRVGYFTSSATAPYNTVLDGFFLESDGVNNTYYIKIYNNGTLIESIEFTQWDGYNQLSSYNWNNFTICLFDFLWLGGAELRVIIKNPNGGFILAHTYKHAGNTAGLFIESPNQCLRYEINSTTGTGDFNSICSQIASEGSIAESGQMLGLYNSSLVSCNSVGTTYVLMGMKKVSGYRDNAYRIDIMGAAIASNDTGVLLLLRNPTLSGALTYAANSRIEVGYSTGQTVSANGRVLAALSISGADSTIKMKENILSWMSMQIDDTPDEYILAYTPLTTNQSVAGVVNVIEF